METPLGPADASGLDLLAMDMSITPGDDFFEFANGAWLQSFEIPTDRSSYGASTPMYERARQRVQEIVEGLEQSSSPADSDKKKLADFYSAFMDLKAIEDRQLDPAKPYLEQISKLRTHKEAAIALLDPALAARSPVGVYVTDDYHDPTQSITYITQHGLGMPNLDYYLEHDLAGTKTSYLDYLADILECAGVSDAVERAQRLLNLETEMAKVHWERSKSRQLNLTYNRMGPKELEAYAPNYPWRDVFVSIGIDPDKDVVLREIDALQALTEIFYQTPIEVWKDHLRVHFLGSFAHVLPSNIRAAHHEFYRRVLAGAQSEKPRSERATQALNSAMGYAIGRLYVSQHFPESHKVEIERLVQNLIVAFRKRLNENSWMSPHTRDRAISKLGALGLKIGYPKSWPDYSDLVVKEGDAFGNEQRAYARRWKKRVERLESSIDRDEWFMTPQTPNAYYSPTRNEVVFPAAFLQPPYYDPASDIAIQYGSIGMTIAHEIAHGFDDQGRLSDENGSLVDWWTAEDEARYQRLSDQLGVQYSAYEPLPGRFIDARLTMGENIADLSGTMIAFEAHRIAQGQVSSEVLHGLTPDQRFFLGYAQLMKHKYMPSDIRRRLTTDRHAIARYRVNGVVRNIDAWYEAFDVSPSQALYLSADKRAMFF